MKFTITLYDKKHKPLSSVEGLEYKEYFKDCGLLIKNKKEILFPRNTQEAIKPDHIVITLFRKKKIIRVRGVSMDGRSAVTVFQGDAPYFSPGGLVMKTNQQKECKMKFTLTLHDKDHNPISKVEGLEYEKYLKTEGYCMVNKKAINFPDYEGEGCYTVDHVEIVFYNKKRVLKTIEEPASSMPACIGIQYRYRKRELRFGTDKLMDDGRLATRWLVR